MEVTYVCEWEKRPKNNHCPSIPLVCSWSCRNLVAFTTDLKADDEDNKGTIWLIDWFRILLVFCTRKALNNTVQLTQYSTCSIQIVHQRDEPERSCKNLFKSGSWYSTHWYLDIYTILWSKEIIYRLYTKMADSTLVRYVQHSVNVENSEG